jgi:hypothetical protein
VRFRVADLDPRLRRRLAIGGAAAGVAVGLFAACGGCRRPHPDPTSAAAVTASAAAATLEADGGASARSTSLLWASARDGDAEDLMTLASQEGAVGLVEAASDTELRPTAIRAMGFARGWAQLPFLARVGGGKDDAEAKVALDAVLELAARPRRAEDPEDSDELREGCEALDGLARDAARPRARRVLSIRALRMMPCPASKAGELPTDLDAR